MQAKQATFLVSLSFALALAAGAVAGRATARIGAAPPSTEPATAAATGSALAVQLQLTPEQTEQMRPIWESARDVARSCAAEAERIQQENDEQLQALLTDAQKARYEQITAENHRRITLQDLRRKDAFNDAVARTRQILSPEQWQAYQAILKDRVGEMPG